MIENKIIKKIFQALDSQIGVHDGQPFSIVVRIKLHDFLKKKAYHGIIERI